MLGSLWGLRIMAHWDWSLRLVHAIPPALNASPTLLFSSDRVNSSFSSKMQPHCSVCHMYFVIMYYCVQITSPQFNGLKNPNSHYFVASVASQEPENSLVGCLCLRASRKPATCLLGLRSHLKAQLGGLLQLLAEFSFSRNVRLLSLHWLGASLSSLPWGHLHRAAHNVAAGLPQGEQVSEWQSVRGHARWKPHPLCNS